MKGEILWLGKKAMHDCTVCYKCMENGQCIYGLVNEVAVCMDEFDGVIVGLSVYYGVQVSMSKWLPLMLVTKGSVKLYT